MIEFKDVSFQYEQGSSKGKIENINLTIHDGEVVLICGESGCGKTTLTRLINGLIPHYYEGTLSGQTIVEGIDVKNVSLYALSGVVGSVFQNPRTQFFTVDTTSEIAFGCENLAIDADEINLRIEKTAGALKIENLLNRSLFALSGGEKQKIACASVSAMEPDIFVLDEPSSNLDMKSIRELKNVLREWKIQGERMKRITKIEENMPLEKRKLRVAAYCRVSTARDEQLVSLAAQKAHYESYIKSNDEWEFAGLYYDKGISGTKKEKRDGLLAMVAACERGTIDFVITKSISRFARNTTDCLELVRKLLDLKIYIYFEKENLNTGSMESELMLSILSSLAESESVSISENEKWGIKRRFQNGTFIISYPPYGYDNVDGEMVIVPEQAEIVKQIFADTLAGKSTHEIAEELNERGVATKKGGHWTPGAVNAIIGNEKYTGDVLLQKTYTDSSFNRHQNRGELDQYLMQDHHEAIISKEEFELANAVLKQRGREKGNGHDTGRYQNRYGFSGRICCGECGGKYKRRMHYKPSGQYVAWACANHLKDKESCSQKYITDDALKLAFVTMMNKLVFGHQMVLRPLLQSLRGLNDQSRLLKIEELETAIEKNRDQKQVLTNLMASGYLEPALFNKESNELAAEEDTLRQEKDGLMRSVNGDMVKIEELQRLLRFVSKGTMLTEFDDKTFLSFAERITVLSRKEVVFELKCGLSLRERLVEP